MEVHNLWLTAQGPFVQKTKGNIKTRSFLENVQWHREGIPLVSRKEVVFFSCYLQGIESHVRILVIDFLLYRTHSIFSPGQREDKENTISA